MSTVSESRVVEMRFDNQQFEANAKETLNTLEQLKRALETNINGDAFNELDRAARNVDLSGIEAGIEALTDRFSTLGIVGMTVIQNITNALTNTLGKAVNYVTSSITSGGLQRAKNIETARFQLQGILQDEQKVQTVMQNALESVDKTAYGYDQAAKAASQLAASGVEAGEQMTSVLKGIAGVAATTSADYDSISHVFTTAAGQGKIMTEQLRQLENRGLNAAATLADYFNKVKNTGEGATEAVKQQIAALTGASDLVKDTTETIGKSSQKSYDTAKKAADNEYNLKKKTYDKEYKELQKALNNEYNAKKKAYDQQYKALQETLNNEVEAVQEANSKRIEELQEAYERDVEAYRDATNEKIALINEEYTESIKLIDEERYNKIKAVEDQIKAIQDQAKAEQKALKDQANQEKLNTLESLAQNSKGTVTRMKAAQELAEFQAELAREQLAEDRANQIEDLQNQKSAINEEAQQKKEEAQEKAQAAKEAVQEESSAELKAMQKAHQAELTQLRKQQAEELSAMREANSERLAALRESQNEELSVYKEGQNEQLEAFREKQNEELSLLRENQNEMLNTLKTTGGKAAKYASQFGGLMDITEADIREMVTDGLISFDIFSEAMANTFGAHAADADRTFEGSMANIRAALSRTGALFYTPLIEEGGPLVKLFNTIRDKINELNGALTPFAGFVTTWLNYTVIPKLTEFVSKISFDAIPSLYTIRNIMDSVWNVLKFIGSIIGVVVDAFKDLFNLNTTSFSEFSLELKTLTSNLKLSSDASSKLSRFLKSIVKLFKSLVNIGKKVVSIFTPLTKLFGVASNSIGIMSNGVSGLIETFADWLDNSKALDAVFSTLTKGMDLFVDAIIKVRDKIRELSERLKGSEIGQSFANGFVEGIKAVGTTIWSAITEFCTGVINKVKELFGIKSPSTVMYEMAVNFIQGFINGLIEFGKTLITKTTEIFTKVIDSIKTTFTSVNWKDLFKDGLEASTDFVTQFAENIRNGIPRVIEAITDFFKGISDFVHNRKDGQEAGEGFGTSFIQGIKNFASNLKNNISNVFFSLFSNIHLHFDANAIKEGFANGGTYIVNFFKGVKNKLKEYVSKAGEWFKTFFSNIDGTSIAALASGAAAAIGGLILILKNLDLSSLIKMFKILKPMVKIATLLSENMEKITSSEKFQELMSKFHLQGLDTALNFVAGFVNGITDKIPSVLEKVKEFALGIVDKVKEILGIQSPSTVMYAIGGFIVAGLILGITNNIGGLRDKIKEAFDTVIDTVKTAFAKIKEDLPAIGAMAIGLAGFVGLIKLAKTLIRIVNPFTAVSSALTSVKKALVGYQMDLKADALLKVAEAVAILSGVILGLYEITKKEKDIKRLYVIAGIIISTMLLLTVALGIFTKMTTSLNKETDKWTLASKGVKKALSSWGMSKVLDSFGKAMIEIVLAIVGLAKMYDKYPDATNRATGIILSIAVVATVFALASAAIAKETGEANTKVNNAASSFLYIAAGLLAIINSLQKLINMGVTFKKNWEQLAILGIILTILLGITVLFGKLNDNTGENMSLNASSVLAFCVLVYATIVALNKIIKLVGEDGISSQAIDLLIGIFIAVAILMVIVGKVASNGKTLVGAAGLLFGACAIIIVTILAIYALIDMDPMKILKGVGTVALILIAIGVCIRIAGNIEGNAFKSIIAIAATVSLLIAALGVFYKMAKDPKKLILTAVAMAIVIASLALLFFSASKIPDSKGKMVSFLAMIAIVGEIGLALYFLSQRPWEQMAAAGGAMALCILAFGRAIKSITESENKTDISEFVGFLIGSIAMIMIGAALAIAATQDWKSILAAGGSISAVILAYAGAFKLFSSSEKIDLENVGMFILGTLSILVIALALTIAASQDWDSMLAAGVAISVVLLAYAESFKIFGQAEVNIDDVGNYILGTISVIIVALALAIAASQPWDSLLAAGASIGTVLDMYAAAMFIFSKANVNMDDVANFLLGCIGVILVGGILTAAATQDWKSLLAAGVSISVVLIAMAVAMLIASFAGTIAPQAIIGIGLLDLFIADLVGVLTVLGGLSKIPGFTELIADGGAVLVQLGTALGNFVGSIVGGVLESISDTFPTIGTNLAKFMENAQPFLDGLAQVTPEMVDAAGMLAGVMLALGVADLLDSFSIIDNVLSLFTPTLAEKFTGLGEALVSFATTTKDINAYHAKASAEACVEMVNVMDSIKGRDFRDAEDLQEFGSNIADFATECQNAYNNLGKETNVDLYDNVSQIMTKMIGVVGECSARDFRDGEELPEFGNNLADFALDLRAVQSYAKDLVESNFEAFHNCAEWVMKIAKLIPRQQDSNSFVGAFFGSNDIGEFGNKLKTFASSVVGISEVLKENLLLPAVFENLYNCADWVIQIAERIPKSKDGLSAFFSGNNDLGTFGEKLESFTTSLYNIQKGHENGLDASIFENIKDAAEYMIDIANDLKSVAESDKNYNVGTTLKNFGTNLESFGKSIKDFGEKANKGYLGFSGAIELLEKLVSMIPTLLTFDGTKISVFLKDMKDNGVNGLTNFLNAFNNSKDAVTKAIAVMFSNIGEAMTSKKTLMEGYSRVIIGYFSTGIKSEESLNKVKDAISNLLSRTASSSRDNNDMERAGEYAVAGFVRGIRNKLDDAKGIGRELGDAAYNAARRALDERSPSKKMAEVGSYAGEGFVNGFAKWIKASSVTATELGESAHDGLKEALDNISTEIQNEDLINPVITPVLDLSDVQKQASNIDDMLNSNRTIDLATAAKETLNAKDILSMIGEAAKENAMRYDQNAEAYQQIFTDMTKMFQYMMNKFGNLQVVMDTGALVGEISSPVDDQIGFYSVLNERGVR